MKAGTIWRIRVAALRQGFVLLTRALRTRHLPTKHGHAALRRSLDVIRVYQRDSSSKRPASSVVSGLWEGGPSETAR
jgi:hypothetical protein